ncbi:MAG: hypothetical protein V1740_06365 [Candidatus Woesearchaeota archaeon]
MKKGQGLSLNTIIIALLVLIVLVALVLIFTGRINLFRGGLKDCAGECMQTATGCSNGKIGYYLKDCSGVGGEGGDYCCPKNAPE